MENYRNKKFIIYFCKGLDAMLMIVINLFRVRGYPEDMLTSYIETMAWIEKRVEELGPQSVVMYGNTITMLSRFWDEHLEGLIKFG